MPACEVCGSNVDAGNEVCPDCGTEMSAGVQSPAPIETAVAAAPAAPAAPPVAPDLSLPPPVPAASSPPAAPTPTPVPAQAPLVTGGTQASLTVKRGGALTADVFSIAGRVVVGRFDTDSGPVDVDLALLPEAEYVSRQHAEVWCDGSGQWFVKDLGSRNGTFVRRAGEAQFQRAVDAQPIGNGDEIALGNARFEFGLSGCPLTNKTAKAGGGN